MGDWPATVTRATVRSLLAARGGRSFGRVPWADLSPRRTGCGRVVRRRRRTTGVVSGGGVVVVPGPRSRPAAQVVGRPRQRQDRRAVTHGSVESVPLTLARWRRRRPDVIRAGWCPASSRSGPRGRRRGRHLATPCRGPRRRAAPLALLAAVDRPGHPRADGPLRRVDRAIDRPLTSAGSVRRSTDRPALVGLSIVGTVVSTTPPSVGLVGSVASAVTVPPKARPCLRRRTRHSRCCSSRHRSRRYRKSASPRTDRSQR